MKIYKKIFSVMLVLYLLISMNGTAFAASYTGDTVRPGLSDIQPGDTLTHPELTGWATLTANWGVRVTFVDWNNTELKSEIVPVTDTASGSSFTPADPARSGYTFTGWERSDNTSGTAILNDDGSVIGVNGPGPIIFMAKYKQQPVGYDSPKTGDISHWMLWGMILAISIVVVITDILFRKKEKNR